LNRILAAAFSLAVIAASALIQSTPAYAVEPSMFGTVLDVNTRLPVNNVCVTVGPPVRCATNTKADGTWSLDMTGAPNGIQWDVRLLLGGQIKAEFLGVTVTGPTQVPAGGPALIDATGFVTPPACGAANTATPTATSYLPNITKTLGGPTGWQTPFIVQNTGTLQTTLESSPTARAPSASASTRRRGPRTRISRTTTRRCLTARSGRSSFAPTGRPS